MLIKFSEGDVNFKYKAVIYEGLSHRIVQFGDKSQTQFYDKTPLRLYKAQNDFDKEVRRRRRVGFLELVPFSQEWFTVTFLF